MSTTQQNMSTTATLAAMPPEVLENIADFATSQDLKSLRLVSRDMASKVLRTYTRALFEHQAYFLNSEASLAHALPVASHPVFGPALRTLSLLIDEISRDHDLEKEMGHNYGFDASHKRRMRKMGMPWSRKLEKKFRVLDASPALWLEQERFRDGAEQGKALHRLMKQIKQQGTEVIVNVTDTGGCLVEPVELLAGNCIMARAAARESPEWQITQPFEILHQALSDKEMLGNVVKSINFCADDWSLPANMETVGSLDGLTSLQLTVNTLRPPSGEIGDLNLLADREAVALPLLKMLASAGTWSLRHLSITAQTCHNSFLLAPSAGNADVVWLLLKETLPTLATLHLKRGYVKMNELKAFAARHPSLRQLGLEKIRVGGWASNVPFVDEEIQEAVGVVGDYKYLQLEDW